MKRKLLVVFIFALLLSIIIYKRNFKENTYKLYIGEIDYINEEKYSNKFLYTNITYSELINRIKQNDFIILKNKKIYLNQLIMSADIIVINANNIEFNKICNKKNLNFDYYLNRINQNKKELIDVVNKMTHAKIIIKENKCKNKS